MALPGTRFSVTALMVMALHPSVLLAPLLAFTQAQQTPQPPQERAAEEVQSETESDEEEDPAAGTEDQPEEAPAAPELPPPDGILPITELARFSYAPSDRPHVHVDEHRLIIVTAAGLIDAFDTTTHELSWKLGLPGERLLPPVLRSNESVLFLISESGKLLEVDTGTGNIRTEHEIGLRPSILPLLARAPGTFVFVGSEDGKIRAYDLATSSVVWTTAIGERPRAFEHHGQYLFVSGGLQSLFALDTSSGDILYQFKGRGAFYAPAAVGDQGDRLYIGDDAGDFYSLDLESGDVKFRWATGAAIRSRALVEGDRVYVATYANTLFAFHARNGHEQWRARLPGRPAGSPARVNERLLVTTLDGALVEVRPDQGRQTSSGQIPGEPLGPPSLYLAPKLAPIVDLPDADPDGSPAERDARPSDTVSPHENIGLDAREREERPAISEPSRSKAPPDGEREVDAQQEGEEQEEAGTKSEAEEGEGEGEAASTEPSDPPTNEAPRWYENSRVAAALRTGEVVLLGHVRQQPASEADSETPTDEGEQKGPGRRKRPTSPPGSNPPGDLHPPH